MKLWSKRSGYFHTLLRYFAAFSLLLLAAGALLLGWAMHDSASAFTPVSQRDLTEYDALLRQGRYDRFPADKVLGEGGYIQVTDSKGRVLYTQRESGGDFTPDELACVPLHQQGVYRSVSRWESAQGEMTLVASDAMSANDRLLSQEPLILRPDGTIAYGSIPGYSGGALDGRAYGYLTQTLPEDYLIWKHPFAGEDGENRWLILYEAKSLPLGGTLGNIWLRTLVLFLLVYAVVLVGMTQWLSRRVSRPLNKLSHGLSALAHQRSYHPIQYRGPREFEEICQAFNRLASRLQESELQRIALEQNRQKLLADISHDLKTPITVIQGYAKAVRDGLVPPEKVPDYLDIIQQKANRLTDLIESFHEYSKLEHPQFTLHTEPMDLCEVLREYLAGKYSELELAGFVPQIDIPEEPLRCALDKTAFVRVLENLVGNALKHNPAGTRMLFSLSLREGQARLLIADSGTGIPLDLTERIFDPFVVGDEARTTRQGSGLGLAISRKIVEAHGGSICLVQPPHPGWGAEFEVLLPLLSS